MTPDPIRFRGPYLEEGLLEGHVKVVVQLVIGPNVVTTLLQKHYTIESLQGMAHKRDSQDQQGLWHRHKHRHTCAIFSFRFEAKIRVHAKVAHADHSSGRVSHSTSSQFLRCGSIFRALGSLPDLYV